MKNIFTLVLFILFTASIAWAQSEIRLVDVDATTVVVQVKLGPSAVMPGPSVDPCNPDPNSDAMISDLVFAISWTDPTIVGLDIVDIDDDGNPCTPTTNTPNCDCLVFEPFCPPPGIGGTGYGIAELISEQDVAGTVWSGYSLFTEACTFEGYITAPVQWESGTWYDIVTLQATLNSTPPGVDPLALTDMISIDETTAGNGVATTNFSPNMATGTSVVGQENNALAINSDPLPLSLISFDANKEGERSAKLEWTTANEIDTKVFIIERSTDRQIWEDVAGVEAAGYSSGIVEYSFIDKNVYNGRTERQTYYYRLRMVDADDSFTHSNIDVVSFSNGFNNEKDAFSLFVFPNPARDGFNVEISQAADENPITRLELLDITGRVVYSRDIDSGSLIEYVDFSRYNVTAGTYVLKASDNQGNAKTHEKIVVTR